MIGDSHWNGLASKFEIVLELHRCLGTADHGDH